MPIVTDGLSRDYHSQVRNKVLGSLIPAAWLVR
jgi:hypothetical protein